MAYKKILIISVSVITILAVFSFAKAVPNFTTGLNVSSGNVGIGTTNPLKKLTVWGGHSGSEIQLYSTGCSSGSEAVLNLWASEPNATCDGVGIGNNIKNWDGATAFVREHTNRGGSYIRLLSGGIDFNVVSSSGVKTDAMDIDGSGNVGIGKSPTTKLDVNGTITATTFSGGMSGTLNASNLSAGTFGANTGGGNYSFSGSVGIGTNSPYLGKLHINASGASLNLATIPTADQVNISYGYNGANSWIFREAYASSNWGLFHNNDANTFDFVGGSASRLHINLGNGNVGIGTTNPSTNFQAVGVGGTNLPSFEFRNSRSGTNNYVGTRFVNTYGNHSWGATAEFRTEGPGDRPGIIFSSTNAGTSWGVGYLSGTDDNFRIATNYGYPGSSWGTPRLTIDTSGNVTVPGRVGTSELCDETMGSCVDPQTLEKYYRHTIDVAGSCGNFYQVVVLGGDQTRPRRIKISRAYSLDPDGYQCYDNDDSPGSHVNALILDMIVNQGGWGGQGYVWDINRLQTTYHDGVADAGFTGNGNDFYVMLLGGYGTTNPMRYYVDLYDYDSTVQVKYSSSETVSYGVPALNPVTSINWPNLYAHWTLTGRGIYSNGSSIGIGNASPSYKLDVSGNGAFRSGDNSYIYFGPNSSYGGALYVGATPNRISNYVAQVISTDGNLHLDSGSNNNMYLNYYSGRQVLVYGPITSNSSITATSFSGALSGTLNAANVSAGSFGGNTGGGNYIFPSGVIVDTTAGGTSSLSRTLTIKQSGNGQINFGAYPGSWTSALQIQNNTGSDMIWISPLEDGTNARFRTGGSGLDFYVGGTSADVGNHSMTLADNGRVGIGTTNPGNLLHVFKNSTDNAAFQGLVKIQGANSSESSTGTFNEAQPSYGIEFRRWWTPGGAGYENPQGGIYSWGSSGWGAGLAFRTAAPGGTNYTRMVVTDTGNVGIGTLAPGYKLEVIGNTVIRGDIYCETCGNWLTSLLAAKANHRGEGANYIDYAYGLYDAYRGGWRTSNDLYVAYAYSAGNAATAEKINGYSSSPNNSHPGHGLRAFYSWNIGQAYNDTSGYSNGISIGSNSGDTNYGFQIVQNMWDDRLYFRRYDYGWKSWLTVIDSATIGSQSVNYAASAGSASSAGNADTVDGQHFAWSNADNNPSYLWGANSNGSSFLVARGSMSVNYANSSGNSDTVDGVHASSFVPKDAWWGSTYHGSDGNIYLGWRGQWLSTVLDAKSDSGHNHNDTSPSFVDVSAYTFNYRSDINLKKNITSISNPIEKIMQLRGVTFNWKKDDSTSIGLIAQEVEKVFPELVSGEDGSKSVQYGNLVAPLIEAVKAQQKEIESLKKQQLESSLALQLQINSLRAKLQALEMKFK